MNADYKLIVRWRLMGTPKTSVIKSFISKSSDYIEKSVYEGISMYDLLLNG